MVLVQISDTHIEDPGVLVYGRFETAVMLERAVRTINQLSPAPDLVLHTGDIVSHGSEARYERFAEIMGELTVPLRLMPGNHDDRATLRRVFKGHEWLPGDGNFLHFVIDMGALRIVCCDSVIEGSSRGELCAERLRWLKDSLDAAPEQPTIIALHHPPFFGGMTGSTARGLESGGPELIELLERNRQVVRVICGHVHRPITAPLGPTIAFSGPTTCYPFGLDWGPERVLAMTGEPPAVAVHFWLEDATPSGPGLVTHVLPVGDWGERIPLLRDGVPVL
ncbi:MAG: phosphodiesterase [Pseudomonadota bacterium]